MTPSDAIRRRAFLAATGGGALLPSWSAHAQGAWPQRPVRIIVPFAAGGPVDVVARLLGGRLRQVLGQPFVVENRVGSGGNIGMAAVAAAPADGYTLAMNGNSYAVNFSLYGSLPFKAADFVPVSMLVSAPLVLVAPGSSPHRTIGELLAQARSQGNALSYASGGVGTIGHLGMHWFSELAQVKMLHVPYKGAPAAMQDLVGGQVNLYLNTVATTLPMLPSGRIRPLLVTSRSRLPEMPDVPTAAEAGFPDMSVEIWQVLLAAAATPPDVLQRLHAEVTGALQAPEVRQGLAASGFTPFPTTPQEATAFLQRETERWTRVVRQTGARAE
ncbi:MAG TPA: tripartite tricarboxylate transporter substrate binding protein [Ramlibacter sp.]|nr:tripartite tricarboxylate transporter substrate binding protein [Ramlibacter sp.]